ncbi:ATP-binding cassette domain-containing protein [Eionea flava]
MITLDKVSLALNGKHCLQDIDAHIEQTGITVIAGANGAGKTLLLQLLAGLQPSYTGRYLPSSTLTCPAMTYLPSTPVLLDRSVSYNIALPLIAREKNTTRTKSQWANHLFHSWKKRQQSQNQQITARVDAALTWAGIESLEKQSALSLSSGQQQLVALARAWALSPTLLLLDEPCANLDPNRQQKIDDLLQAMSTDCKIILSSHTISQARRIADDILFLDQGNVISHLKHKEFFASEAAQTLPKCIQQWMNYA